MATLNEVKVTGVRQGTDKGRKKPLIGTRATALPKNIVNKLGLSRSATHYNFELGLIKLNESSESN